MPSSLQPVKCSGSLENSVIDSCRLSLAALLWRRSVVSTAAHEADCSLSEPDRPVERLLFLPVWDRRPSLAEQAILGYNSGRSDYG
jgi:hypothetical protein